MYSTYFGNNSILSLVLLLRQQMDPLYLGLVNRDLNTAAISGVEVPSF